MGRYFYFLILLSLFCNFNSGEIVETTGGLVNGILSKSKSGREFLAYWGIPYAAPPIGNLRFKAPINPPSWRGIRNSSAPPACVQPDTLYSANPNFRGQEDCLYLNVFTPLRKYRESKKLPVMVFIHGGAFKIGYSGFYNPEYFMDKNVVLVTLNYRLGALGFFSLGSDPIPGNYGLKDQSFALKWVQNNIYNFGGDPKKVTLFGQSSGSICVNLHMFSPLSKDLFQQAIMHSNTAISPASFFRDNMTQVFSHAFLFVSGCYFDNPNTILSCLKNLKPEVFAELANKFYVWNFEPIITYRANIENNHNKITKKGWLSKIKNKFEGNRQKDTDPPFLPAEPSSQTYVSRVPCIMGHNSGEGILFITRFLKDGVIKDVEWLNENYKTLLPVILEYIYVANEPENFMEAIETIKNYYFGNEDIGPDTYYKLVELYTDGLFTYPIAKNILSNNVSQQYVYLYDHKSVHHKQNSNYERDFGVNHGDELHNFFYSVDTDRRRSSNDEIVSKRLLDYWVNFATYGDPNGKNGKKLWKPTTSDELEYLHIKTEDDEMKNTLFKEKYKFWSKLPVGI